MIVTDTLIIGAGAAGLASAACLQKQGIKYIMLEKQSQVATAWRNHYDRLHLHTSKKWSALPFKKFDKSLPQYPSRQQVVDYLEGYRQAFDIDPVFDTEVLSLKKENGKWIIETNNHIYQSTSVIVSTGMNRNPNIPHFNGLDSFKGTVLHSSGYKNGKAFAGKNVLVVGFGNSACEQAICLYEHGAKPFLSVRSAVNVIPRDIFGFSVLEIGKLTSMFPTKLRDRLNAPLIKMLLGDITKLGLKRSTYGPFEQIQKQQKIPLLDIGTIKLIRQGHIKVVGDIVQIENNTVHFEDNVQQDFDAIILATGYKHGLGNLLGRYGYRINDLDNPVNKQSFFGKDGLYFCGFYVSPTGMLREIGIEARAIAEDIAGLSGQATIVA